MTIRIIALVALTISVVTKTAEAEPKAGRATSLLVSASDAGYEYSFIDESVQSGEWSPYSDWIRRRAGSERSLLIRPRASFVPELLVSVQTL